MARTRKPPIITPTMSNSARWRDVDAIYQMCRDSLDTLNGVINIMQHPDLKKLTLEQVQSLGPYVKRIAEDLPVQADMLTAIYDKRKRTNIDRIRDLDAVMLALEVGEALSQWSEITNNTLIATAADLIMLIQHMLPETTLQSVKEIPHV